MTRDQKTAASLDTDDRIMNYARTAIGRARRREPALRFLPLDAQFRHTKKLLSLTGRPSSFDEHLAENIAHWVDECADKVSFDQLVAVWQRRGTAEYALHELPWIRNLDEALCSVGYPVRAWLLSHSRGLRWVALDDLLPAR